MSKFSIIGILSYVFVLSCIIPGTNGFAEGDHDHHHYEDTFHFAHPLITESPTPDTKIRFDYFFLDVDGEVIEEGFEAEAGGDFNEHTVRLELEYAFSPNISIEADIPYTFLDVEDGSNENNFNNIELGIKLVSFRFAEHGVVFGGGFEVGLPTGDDDKGIGSDNIIELEPFISFGYKNNNFEYITFLSLGFPVNQDDDQDAGDEFGYNVSFLYHIGDRVDAILEFDGEWVFNGEEDGETVINIDPGIIIFPFDNSNINIGVGAGFPLTDDEEFNYRLIASIFFHIHP